MVSCSVPLLLLQITVTLQSADLLFSSGGLKQIVAEEGAVGLYRGLGPQFVALLPNWAVGHLAAVCPLSRRHVL